MKNRLALIRELDAAVDRMDEAAVDQILDLLEQLDAQHIQAEEAAVFAARIRKKDKENNEMNGFRQSAKWIVAVAAVALIGVTVYASGALHTFSFAQGDRYVTIRSTQPVDELEFEENLSTADMEGADVVYIPPVVYTTVAEAEKALDMKVLFPAQMPNLPLERVEGQQYDSASASHSILWLNYGDLSSGKAFGMTISRYRVEGDADATSLTVEDMDEGSLGVYQSSSGTVFQTRTESDESGQRTAHIATVPVGEYEYALVFVGFDEAERQAVMDSVDLTQYK